MYFAFRRGLTPELARAQDGSSRGCAFAAKARRRDRYWSRKAAVLCRCEEVMGIVEAAQADRIFAREVIPGHARHLTATAARALG
jgi:hypothetical protein